MEAKRILALFLSVLMFAGVMAGCEKAPAEKTPPVISNGNALPSGGPAAWDGKNISVCLASEPQTIDPALNYSLDGAVMLQHFFEGLLKWEDSGTALTDSANNAVLAPGQAESWEKTDNGDGTVTYTFKLRQEAKWSDGQPVTAGDFVYSWQRLADPATAANYFYIIDMVKGFSEVAYGSPTGVFEDVLDEETGDPLIDAETGETVRREIVEYADPSALGVSAPDDHTFVVDLSYDCPYFEEICAFSATFPVRRDIIESVGEQWTHDTATYISNGPYKLSEWVHNSYIEAAANESYYGVSELGPETITFQLMDDQNAMYGAYESGTLQFIHDFPQGEVTSLLASGDLKIVDYLGTYFATFQTQKEPFDDARVRKAFSLVIDRNYIVDKVTKSGEAPATGIVPSGVLDSDGYIGDDFRTVGGDCFSVEASDYETNCEEARALLEDAGYPNGEGFPVVEYLYNSGDAHKEIAEALQNMWKTQLGVEVVLKNQEWGVMLYSLMDGDYQIARANWTADYNDPCSFLDVWYTNGGNNIAHYSNPAFDAAIDAAKATDDPTERMKQFHIAEDIAIGEDSVIAPIYFYTEKYMLQDGIEGMYYTPLGYYFFGRCTPAG